MSGANALLAIKAALRAHLLAHAPITAALPGGIHDAAPRSVSPAYLVIGEGTSRENGTSDASGFIVDLDLAIHTKERGTAEGVLQVEAHVALVAQEVQRDP